MTGIVENVLGSAIWDFIKRVGHEIKLAFVNARELNVLKDAHTNHPKNCTGCPYVRSQFFAHYASDQEFTIYAVSLLIKKYGYEWRNWPQEKISAVRIYLIKQNFAPLFR